MCFTGARDDCQQAPSSELVGAGDTSYLDSLGLSENWAQYLWIAAIGLGGLVGVGVVRELFCPKEGSKLIVGFVSSLMLLAGAALTGLVAVAIFGVSVHSYVTLVAVEVNAFLDETALHVLLAVGVLLLTVGLATLCAMCCKSRKLLLVILCFWVLLLLFMFGLSTFMAYWID